MKKDNFLSRAKYWLLLISIMLSAVYWILDTLFTSLLRQQGVIFNPMIAPGNVDLVRRIVVAGFIIGFAAYSKHLLNQERIAQDDILEREERFRRLVELSPDAIAIQSEDKIVYMNSSGASLFGARDVEEIMGKSVWDFLPTEYKRIVERRYKQIKEEGITAQPIEMELVRLDDRRVDVEVTAVPFVYNGKPAFQAVFHDITTRKWVEEEIRQRNIELAALNSIAETVSQSLDLNKILNDALNDVIQLDMLGGQAQGMIFLRSERSDILQLAAHKGAPENHPCLTSSPRVGECLCGLVVQTGEPILSECCHTDERHTRTWPDMPHHKDVCLPLKVRGSISGAMNVRFPADKDIGENVVELLSSVADQVSVAVENARLFEEVRQQRNKLRILGTRLAETEEAERKRLARELHDQVGEGLTALGINLNIIRTQFSGNEQAKFMHYLEESLMLVDKTTERIRDVMAELRPPMLDDYGLLATLRWYGERFSDRADVSVIAVGEEPDPRLSESVENTLFRVTIEALTNVAKHAHASHVTIRLDEEEDTMRLTVSDDGVGFNTDHPPRDDPDRGWGMLTMAERTEAIGGRFHIESSTSGGGTQVVVELDR